MENNPHEHLESHRVGSGLGIVYWYFCFVRQWAGLCFCLTNWFWVCPAGWLDRRVFVLRNGNRPRKGVPGLVRLLAGALSECCRTNNSRSFTRAYTYNLSAGCLMSRGAFRKHTTFLSKTRP